MKNSGKSSAIFLLFIPIFFIIALIIVDTIFNYVENNKYKKISEKIISEVMDDSEINNDEYLAEIKKRYQKLGYNTDMLIVEANDYNLYIENEHSFFGIFSSLFNNKKVESEIEILGVKFKIRKNSVARIKVNVSYDDNGEKIFEYEK